MSLCSNNLTAMLEALKCLENTNVPANLEPLNH